MPAPYRILTTLAMLVALALPAAAQRYDWRDPARVDGLSDAEHRYLQAALAFAGDYEGLLDGAWGTRSRTALSEWSLREAGRATPTWGGLRDLVARFEDERARNGWTQVRYEAEGLYHQMPRDLLTERPGGRELRYVSPDGGLALLFQTDARLPVGLHDEFADDARRGTQTYRLRNDDRMITAGTMRGGRHVYVRSDRTRDGWATLILLADDANRGRLRVISASVSRERRPPLGLPPGSTLARLASGTAALPQPAPPPEPQRQDAQDPLERALIGLLDRALDRAFADDDPEPARRPRPEAQPEPEPVRPAIRAATGFYVNTTDVVTTGALLDLCGGRVETRDGVRARELASDRRTGLAVVSLPGRSRSWLAVDAARPRGGTEVDLIARRGGAAETRGGAILRVLGGGEVEHSVPAGPLVTGAPMLDGAGRVAAVSLPPLGGRGPSDLAASGRALAGMLRDAGVVFAEAGGAAEDGRGARDAVVALRCAR